MRKLASILSAAIGCLTLSLPAGAFTYTEQGDAGETIATAQVITFANATSTATDPFLTSIFGSVASEDADIFAISLTAGQLFQATSGPPTSNPTAIANTQLFLFDALGNGLVANDNSQLPGQAANYATITAFTVPTTGIYYLAISGFNYDPRDAGNNFIFPDTTTGQLVPNSGVGALNNWAVRSGSGSASFSYSIALVNAQPTPEPAVGGGLLAFAVLGLMGGWRARQSRA
jgi:hypothetical protein